MAALVPWSKRRCFKIKHTLTLGTSASFSCIVLTPKHELIGSHTSCHTFTTSLVSFLAM